MKIRKGDIAGAIPFLFLVMGASLMGMQAMGIGDAMSVEVVESVSDLERVAQVKHSYDLYLHEYLTQGGEFSIQQTSWDLGQNGGGETWEKDAIPTYADLYVNFNDGSKEYLNNQYSVEALAGDCTIPSEDYGMVLWDKKRKDVWFGIYNSNPISVECQFEQGSVRYEGGGDRFNTNSNASDNRYKLLANESIYFWKEVKKQLSEIQLIHENTETACGVGVSKNDVKQDAHEGAHSQAEDAIEGGFKDAESKYARWPGFVLEDTGSEMTEHEHLDGTPEAWDTGSDCCTNYNRYSCDKDGDGNADETCKTCTNWEDKYKGRTKLEIKEAQAWGTFRDEIYRVLTEQGWVNLEFTVDPYTHPFD